MAHNWPIRHFGELTDNFDAIRVPVKEVERKPGAYPYYGASGVVDHVDGYLFDGEYLLVAEDGENLRTRQTPVAFIARGKFWVNNHAHIVRGNAENDTRYLMYAMRLADISAFLTGSTMPKLTQGNLNRVPVIAPPLPQQRAIAAVLGALDDRVEVNRKTARVLEGLARAVFTSWFVDFDPVRRRTGSGSAASLPTDLAALFPKRLVDSPIGEVPEGWRVIPLPEAFEVNPTRSLKKRSVAPYLDMSNMPTQGHAPAEWVQREAGSGMRFVNGDTLVARITPCLENGKTAFVDFLAEGEVAWGSTEYIVLRPKRPLPPVFAYLLARDERFRTHAIQAMTGSSGRQRVPAESLDHFQIAVPSTGADTIAGRFASIVEPLFGRMRTAMMQNRTLAALRDTLLPKLISGELRIADAEKLVGRAV